MHVVPIPGGASSEPKAGDMMSADVNESDPGPYREGVNRSAGDLGSERLVAMPRAIIKSRRDVEKEAVMDILSPNIFQNLFNSNPYILQRILDCPFLLSSSVVSGDCWP